MPVKKLVRELLEPFRLVHLLGHPCPEVKPGHPALSLKLKHPRRQPRFDVPNRVVIEPAHVGYIGEIKRFVHAHYFQNQQTIRYLGIKRDSSYLTCLAKRYAMYGDRWLAYEMEPKLRKRKLIGALAGFKKFPWEAGRLKKFADCSPKPENYHIHFRAYCIRSANVFNKYRVPYVYDIELLLVTKEGIGVENLLLQTVFDHAFQSEHYPLIQVFSTNKYLNAACMESGMTLEWSNKLSNLTDLNNNSLFYSDKEKDDTTVNLYIRLCCPKKDHIIYHPYGLVRQNPVD
ncbi:hypothetical protein O0L34_g18423 [Tuta absoluta]|nr:hypothetical protein O0L34_g18423 [Tuta absoluta]